MKSRDIIQLIRVKHYIKNFLIFSPLLFAGGLFTYNSLVKVFFAFVAFSAIASVVYIVNDIQDRRSDAKHPTKRNRPIASGRISVKWAIWISVFLVLVALFSLLTVQASYTSIGLLLLYTLINLLYSWRLKHIPIIDVAILSLGFLLRVYYGGVVAGLEISNWLYLSVMAFSLYLGLGKRRNEIQIHGTATRKVNRFYNKEFLDKNMYVCLTLGMVYYSLWTISPAQDHKNLFWTVPLVILIAMTYNLNVENETSDGDPVEVVTNHKYLIVLVVAYGLIMLGLIYIPW